MGVRVARGLFRLWHVFSVPWIAGVGAVTWQSFPVNNGTVVGAQRELSDDPSSSDFILPSEVALDQERHAALQFAVLLALVPPFFVFALGSALRWALLGFRT